MSKFESFSLIRRLSHIGTLLQTRFCGQEVGHDIYGNRYYRDRKTPQGVRERRWFLMPVRWREPFGMAMLEALASGTPVIAFPRAPPARS